MRRFGKLPNNGISVKAALRTRFYPCDPCNPWFHSERSGLALEGPGEGRLEDCARLTQTFADGSTQSSGKRCGFADEATHDAFQLRETTKNLRYAANPTLT